MPFDGLVVKSISLELSEKLKDGRIEKIYQPERDELILSIWTRNGNYKLLLSSSPNHPRIHLTKAEKENPLSPPAFCMLLRKHLSGGRIIDVAFHDFERIVSLHIECYNDLGDLVVKKLVIEIMGRHSNIILVNENGRILDSIKRITSEISSLREVLPGMEYILPPAQDKISPESVETENIFINAKESNTGISRFLLNNIKGFSPQVCNEICSRADIDSNTPVSALSSEQIEKIRLNLKGIIDKIKSNEYTPCVFFNSESDKPVDFHCFRLGIYEKGKVFDSICKAADYFYYERDLFDRILQKKSSIARVLNNNIDRCLKKKAIQEEELRESSGRDLFKLYGELILANVYNIRPNSKEIMVLNYYSQNNEQIVIPLNPNRTPQQNAQAFFKKYNKAKSAYAHISKQLEATLQELYYLESVQQMLESSSSYKEVDEIRDELIEQGYIKQKKQKSNIGKDLPLKPHHYKSSDGFDIFVGRNNKQNDHLTLKRSKPDDLWFHTQKIPGAHVIIRTQKGPIPDSTLYEAALLSAFYSKAHYSSNVPVDYTEVKNIKKPAGAKPGMVIYENYRTIIATPSESKVNSILKVD